MSFSDLNPWHDRNQKKLVKTLGTQFQGTVKDILGNTKEGAGKDLAEIIKLKKEIMSHVNNKINEAGENNRDSLKQGLGSVMREMLSILQDAVQKIDNLEVELFETTSKLQEKKSNLTQEQPVEGPDEFANEESTNMTGEQPTAAGLFMMPAPTGPWGGQVPTPMGNYYVVHGHGWGGAPSSFLNASCARAPDCVPHKVCYVIAP